MEVISAREEKRFIEKAGVKMIRVKVAVTTLLSSLVELYRCMILFSKFQA